MIRLPGPVGVANGVRVDTVIRHLWLAIALALVGGLLLSPTDVQLRKL